MIVFQLTPYQALIGIYVSAPMAGALVIEHNRLLCLSLLLDDHPEKPRTDLSRPEVQLQTHRDVSAAVGLSLDHLTDRLLRRHEHHRDVPVANSRLDSHPTAEASRESRLKEAHQ